MPFAVVQKTLEPPSLAQLQAAFRGVPGLTPLDAHTIGRDAFGVLVKNFPFEHARVLQMNLRAQGIETEVIDERQLPAMPAAKFVSRLDPQPDALLIYDPVGRDFPIQWGHVTLIAAGQVRLSTFKREVTEQPQVRFSADANPYVDFEREVRHREEMNDHLVAEVVLGRASQRLSLRADQFNFAGLGDSRSKDLAENFQNLVRALIRSAPHAAINRGAYYLRETPPTVFSYPSKNAFFEEIVWLLWRMQQGESGGT